MHFNLLISILIYLALLGTRHNLDIFAAIDWVNATDAYSYLLISSSAPNFPSESIDFHFSQRWIPHYLVGSLAEWSGMGLGLAYQLSSGLVIVSILVFSQ